MTKQKKILVKFKNKSNRVKGLAFHPRRPWILSSLHNGVIQLWDYRMDALIDTFDEHDGPVRGVHFHNSQPLFVSGGDDYRIKVWNYQLKRCMFNLLGHLDYIRTVQFHHEHPWILSASDDQTIRIWNWQSRTCLSVLTGHNHYVMCAQFHLREDLVLSASLDQTVRVWDISGLREKSVSVGGGMQASSLPGNDLFGGSDVVVKHVLEGHTRGVNWASFHKTMPLIVSGADDREVKLWRMNDTKAWEVDTMRGHINNVSCVLFHPKSDLIISNAEDKSIRVWDITKQADPLVVRCESDRYWILDAHPKLNLLAAGHDSGMMVFKLASERPPYDVAGKFLYYFHDSYIYRYDLKDRTQKPIMTANRRARKNKVRALHYNSSNRTQDCFLLITDSGSYELYVFPKGDGRDDGSTAVMKGVCRAAVFVTRNRFAVMTKNRTIVLRGLQNELKREIKLPNVYVSSIFPAGIGRLLIRTSEAMLLYDIQSLKVISELRVQTRYPIKYVVWSAGHKYCAMFSMANVFITDNKLNELSSVSENTRIKSGAWDSDGVFLYTTATHVKYLLAKGDSGIVRTLDLPIYLTSVSGDEVVFLDRESNVDSLKIEPTEYLFKVALLNHRNRDVLRIMQTNKLVGQSIIAYLQKRGYPEVALHFVQDEKVKFELALECGNIAVASSCASALDSDDCWHKLGVAALRQGNLQFVEAAYQKTKNFERLSFLYLITGNVVKLAKMLQISRLRQDVMGRFHNALYLGDVGERVTILREAGMPHLAYVAAVVHGLDEPAAELREELGDDVPEVPDASGAKLLFPPTPVLRESNWPFLDVRKGFFDQVEEGVYPSDDEEEEAAEDGQDDDIDLGGWGEEDDLGDLGIGDDDAGDDDDDDEEGGGGWGDDGLGDLDGLDLPDVDGDDKDDKDDDSAFFVMPSDGEPVSKVWQSSTTHAGALVAAGEFDMAMHCLSRQIGVCNFAPLKPHFLSTYNASYALLPLLPGAPSLRVALPARNEDGADVPRPDLGLSVAYCQDLVTKGRAFVTTGKFSSPPQPAG